MSGNAGFTFDPEIVLAAMQECVTIVHPGEILAVRVPPDLDPHEMEQLSEGAERADEIYGVKILFVAGEEFAVIRIRGAVPPARTPS